MANNDGRWASYSIIGLGGGLQRHDDRRARSPCGCGETTPENRFDGAAAGVVRACVVALQLYAVACKNMTQRFFPLDAEQDEECAGGRFKTSTDGIPIPVCSAAASARQLPETGGREAGKRLVAHCARQ